jgi:hypothetical protein
VKVLTAIAIAAALLTSASVATAQNTTPTTEVSPSPSNINKGMCGPQATATMAANGPLSCNYASLSDCQKHNKSSSLHCVANPRAGT